MSLGCYPGNPFDLRGSFEYKAVRSIVAADGSSSTEEVIGTIEIIPISDTVPVIYKLSIQEGPLTGYVLGTLTQKTVFEGIGNDSFSGPFTFSILSIAASCRLQAFQFRSGSTNTTTGSAVLRLGLAKRLVISMSTVETKEDEAS